MMHQRKRSAVMAGLLVLFLAITAATQDRRVQGRILQGNRRHHNDRPRLRLARARSMSTVDGQAISQSTWTAKADTLTFGPVTGPEGYNCAGSAKYLWSIADNRITFTLVADDCQFRSNGLINLVWTKG